MDINDLQIFYTISQLKSVSKAASHLGYVQSNISKRIEKLEVELGHKLFIRSNKGMELLPKGKVFLGYCKEILDIANKLKKEFSIESETRKIGSTQSISRNYLHPLFFDKNVEIYTRPFLELLTLLKHREIDLLYTNRNIVDPSIYYKLIFSEKIGWAKGKSEKNMNWKKPIIVSRDKDCPYRKATFDYLSKNNLDKNTQLIEVDNLDLLLSMIEQNKAYGICPVKIVLNNTFLELVTTEPLQEVPIYECTMKDSNYYRSVDLTYLFR